MKVRKEIWVIASFFNWWNVWLHEILASSEDIEQEYNTIMCNYVLNLPFLHQLYCVIMCLIIHQLLDVCLHNSWMWAGKEDTHGFQSSRYHSPLKKLLFLCQFLDVSFHNSWMWAQKEDTHGFQFRHCHSSLKQSKR